jgi:hypothetical protein
MHTVLLRAWRWIWVCWCNCVMFPCVFHLDYSRKAFQMAVLYAWLLRGNSWAGERGAFDCGSSRQSLRGTADCHCERGAATALSETLLVVPTYFIRYSLSIIFKIKYCSVLSGWGVSVQRNSISIVVSYFVEIIRFSSVVACSGGMAFLLLDWARGTHFVLPRLSARQHYFQSLRVSLLLLGLFRAAVSTHDLSISSNERIIVKMINSKDLLGTIRVLVLHRKIST